MLQRNINNATINHKTLNGSGLVIVNSLNRRFKMFTYDAVIDAVQTGKKSWVNTFVTNDVARDAMIKFIDVQSDYTKKAAKAGSDMVTTLTSETVKALQETAKFDYAKFGEGIMKAYMKMHEQPVK